MAKAIGRVSDLREPCVYISLQDGRAVECVIDTAFDGWLSFPKRLVEDLQLPIIGREKISVLGQRKLICNIALAQIIWLGRSITTAVIVNDGEDVLLGSQLLSDSILRINYRNRRLTVNNPDRE
jgi:clan AA aspartic protease